MIWKTTILLSLALCVLGDGPHATSEQRIKINQKEHGHQGDLKHIGSNPPEHHEKYAWSYPSYEFSYKVHDPHTHDMKGHEESRDGDEVKGEYWLIQPDGHKRTVTYHVDKHSGFKATVKYSDHHHEKDDHGDENKHRGEEGSDGQEGEDGGKAIGGGDEGHEEDKGHNEEKGRDGEESRGLEDYRHAWTMARKEHVREESRRQESRGGDDRSYDNRRGGDSGRGRDGSDDMTMLEKIGSYGRRDSGHGRGRHEGRNPEKSHRQLQQRSHHHDTYNYPRFYRHTQ